MTAVLRWAEGVFAVALAAAGPAHGTEFSFHGQASGWLGAGRDTSFIGLAGLRYLPEVQVSVPVRGQLKLDADASVNAFLSTNARDRACSLGVWLKPYRALIRVSGPRFEARAGLQKISFGSATLLRPLMWFDRVDPRDPLALTDGVYGLLARYYFQNNTNIWAWGLLANSSPKGWEVYGTERWTPEPGARVQFPVPRGEVGVTAHHREASVVYGEPPTDTSPAAETRVGLDGKWDVGVGLCFEATVSKISSDHVPFQWQRMATVGLDYTFGIGSGLGVAAEHMLVGGAIDGPFTRGTDTHLSALMLGLPLGLLDNLKGIVYYDWSDKGVYRFLGWQRTLDDWLFSVTVFWNPDKAPVAATEPIAGATGLGVQLMVVFNH
jgi:hypothetical protein